MLYNVRCPNCGAEQRGLDLEETEGSYICSNCGEHINVNLNDLKENSEEQLIKN